jgi:CheY-like chemotaxis protein
MRRILIVADRLLGATELQERLAPKKSADPEIEVFVLVPERAPSAASGTDGTPAERILESALTVLRELQYDADGEVGDADPLAAVRQVTAARPFDEIILAALPGGGASKWFRLDLAHRMERVTKLPVREIIGEEPAEADEETRLAALRFPGVPAAAAAGDPVRVLLVEDDEGDAVLTRLALDRCPTPNTHETVGDGAEAIEWLRNAGGPDGVDLVLVDLRMPVLDGFELLERLKAEHDLQQLAVVVLTTSNRMEDRDRAHGLGAHAYVTKETSFTVYRDVLEGLLSDVARRER